MITENSSLLNKKTHYKYIWILVLCCFVLCFVFYECHNTLVLRNKSHKNILRQQQPPPPPQQRHYVFNVSTFSELQRISTHLFTKSLNTNRTYSMVVRLANNEFTSTVRFGVPLNSGSGVDYGQEMIMCSTPWAYRQSNLVSAEYATGLSAARRKLVLRFLDEVHENRVRGWLRLEMITLCMLLTVHQHSQLRVFGRVGGFGVHNGRFLIALALVSQPREPLLAVDTFLHGDVVSTNTFGDEYGGNLRVLLRDFRQYELDVKQLQVVDGRSVDLDERMLRTSAQFGSPVCIRFFVIDGGRSAAEVHHDLNTIACLLCKGGIVLVHDVSGEKWPQVPEGWARFMMTQPIRIVPDTIDVLRVPVMVPFLSGYDSLLMTTPDAHDDMLQFMLEDLLVMKMVERDTNRYSWQVPNPIMDTNSVLDAAFIQPSYEYFRMKSRQSFFALKSKITQALLHFG